MYKKIDLDNGNVWSIAVESGYCTNTVSFSKGYISDGVVIKSIDFAIWDDMSFHGYINSYRYPDILEFEFDYNDPIYFCLLELLNGKNQFLLDDDDSYCKWHKYMTIKKEESIIKIIFTNIKQGNFGHNKYGAFVKNIGPDGRSKIENFEIKKQLVSFFRNCANNLLEENHQISFEEYLEIERIKKIEQINLKRVKKL